MNSTDGGWFPLEPCVFTFLYLADAFIQSDLQGIQTIHFFESVCDVCSLGIEPTTFALLTQCSTTEPQEHIILTGCRSQAVNSYFNIYIYIFNMNANFQFDIYCCFFLFHAIPKNWTKLNLSFTAHKSHI